MTDSEQLPSCENAKIAWEEEIVEDPYPSVGDHKGWCAELNYGVNSFGVHSSNAPMSLIKNEYKLTGEAKIAYEEYRKAFLSI